MTKPTANQIEILKALLAGETLTRHLDKAPRLNGRVVSQAAVSGLYQRGMLRSTSDWPTVRYYATLTGVRAARS